MLKIKALTTFFGIVTMRKNEIREVTDETGQDLIQAGHAEAVGPEEVAEAVETPKATKTTKRKTAAQKEVIDSESE